MTEQEKHLKFYIDENIPPAVAEQLRKHGIDALSVRDLESLGDSDLNHLQRAAAMGRVLCTHDQDFLRMAAQGDEHAGIAFSPQYNATIGGWVRGLRDLHERITPEEAKGQIFYLSVS